MNIDDCLVSAGLDDEHAIRPFTTDWQAALVATGRTRRALARRGSFILTMGSWVADTGTVEFDLDGPSTLLLDIRLSEPARDADDDDIARLFGESEVEPARAGPGMGKVDLGIKCPLAWFDPALCREEPEQVVRVMLDAADAVLGRIHLKMPGVARDDDHLASLGRAFVMQQELGLGTGRLRMLHPTPWSDGANVATLSGETVELEAFDEPAAARPWIMGTLKDRMPMLGTSGPHRPMNLLLQPMATTADPTRCDPVQRLRAEAAWRDSIA